MDELAYEYGDIVTSMSVEVPDFAEALGWQQFITV